MTDEMRFTARHAEPDTPDFEALAAFAEGRVSASERAAITDHLSSCATCRAIVAELARGAVPTTAPAGLRWLPIAATLAIAAAGGGVYMITFRTPVSPDTTPAPPVAEPAPQNAAPVVTSPPGATPPSATGTVPSVNTPRGGVPGGPDQLRAAGSRAVAGKKFRLAAGEWIDTEYQLSNFLPEVDIRSRDDLTAHPALQPYASLGARFTVVLSGTVYRVAIPPTNP
jgi:hypothetical protein